MNDKNIDSYLTFGNDKLAALQSQRKLFSSDRGTVVHNPDRKQDTDNRKSPSNLINKRTETKTVTSGQTTPGTRLPYDKMTATKYILNKLKFLNYTPKYPDQDQNQDIVEITIDDDEPEMRINTTEPPTKQIEIMQAPTLMITTTAEMSAPTPHTSLPSSSTVSDTIRVPQVNPTFTPNCLLQIQPPNPIQLVPVFPARHRN